MSKLPKPGDKVVISLRSPVLEDKKTKAINHSGELQKDNKKEYRTVKAVYVDGAVMDEFGERWEVIPSDTPGHFTAIA